jgi:hypothetical protein
MDWSDKRTVDEMKFGAAWKPTLGDIMPDHPWDDKLFIYAPPPVEQRQPDFDPVAEEAVALARWKKRMSEIPTDAAIMAWEEHHRIDLDRVRRLLWNCGVKVADDLKVLGCTGCVAHGLTLDDIKFLRIGLAGSGVGLPCFVPKTRYCLAHEVTGGLQDGQAPGIPEFVHFTETISRSLTPEEASHGKLVHEAQWADSERKAHETLAGRRLPEGWTPGLDAIPPLGSDAAVKTHLWEELEAKMAPERLAHIRAQVEAEAARIQPWTCPEHKKTLWNCRYCVAQAVVEGDLEPAYAVEDYVVEEAVEEGINAKSFTTGATPGELLTEISKADKAQAPKLVVYVRVATFTRKLSRD